MDMENPKQYTSEEMAKLEKSRTISYAELLKSGAEYVFDNEENSRLDITQEQYVELHDGMNEDIFQKAIPEIRKELDELSVEEIIKARPDLSEKFEAIRLEKEGQEVSLFRSKMIPELAFAIWSKSKHRGGTQGKVWLNVPDQRLPKNVEMEFRSVCACCSSEAYGLESPFRSSFPEHPSIKDAEGKDKSDYIFKKEVEEYGKERRKWEQSEEGQKDTEWCNQKKQEFVDAMQNACNQNGIKYLVMRKGPSNWEEHYGSPLNGVVMLEIGDGGKEKIVDKINELKILNGLKKEEVLGLSFNR